MGTSIAPATRARRLDEVFGHQVVDTQLIEQACTHASRCGAQATPSDRLLRANERIEFLGDAVLGAAICLLLFRRHPQASEGALSRRKALLASRQTLARLFDQHDLAGICLVGDQLGEAWPDSVKANLAEGILGGIHLDAGFEALVAAVERFYGPLLDETLAGSPEDAKSELQEWALAHHQCLPTYGCERSGGSDHAPEFTATARLADAMAIGAGTSRRRAEAAAAAALLAQLRK